MKAHRKTRKPTFSVRSNLLSTAAGVVVAGAAACALFGHHIGVPSLMGNVPGTGLAALLPLLVPVLAALALIGCAHFER